MKCICIYFWHFVNKFNHCPLSYIFKDLFNKLLWMWVHTLSIYTTLSLKYPTLGQGEKKRCVTGEAQFLIPIKVGPLWLHTLGPMFLPLLEAFLEGISVPLSRFAWCPRGCQNGNPQWPLQFGEQPEITMSHVWRVGSLANNWNAVFGQETLDQVWWMSWGIVMMQLPIAWGPQVRSLMPNCITKMMDDFQIVFFVDSFAFWCITDAQSHYSQREQSAAPWLCSAPDVLFWALGMKNASSATTAPLFPGHIHTPTTHHRWSWSSGTEDPRWRTPVCPTRPQGKAVIAPVKADWTQISPQLCTCANSLLQVSVQSLCWSQPCQQFLGRSNNGPQESESAHSQWHLHFSLLMASRNIGHCPPMCGHLWSG
jgi:hypothetical protein